MRNRTSDLRIPRSNAVPTSHRDSTVSEVCYEVHMTRVLRTARISNVDSVMFVNRNKRDGKFLSPVKKQKQMVFFHLVTSSGQRKNSQYPMRNRTSDLRIPRSNALRLLLRQTASVPANNHKLIQYCSNGASLRNFQPIICIELNMNSDYRFIPCCPETSRKSLFLIFPFLEIYIRGQRACPLWLCVGVPGPKL